MEAGALDYIVKPFKINAILPVLARARNVAKTAPGKYPSLQQAVGIYELSMVQDPADPGLRCGSAKSSRCRDGAYSGQRRIHAAAGGRWQGAPGSNGARRQCQSRRWKAVSIQRVSFPLGRAQSEAGFPPERTCRRSDSLAAFSSPNAGQFLHCDAFRRQVRWYSQFLTSKNPGRPVSSAQIKALNVLAGAAGSALEAASLLDQLRSAERRYRSLSESAAVIIDFATRCIRSLASLTSIPHRHRFLATLRVNIMPTRI